MTKDLPAVQKAYDLSKELLPRVSKFPRDFRFSLGERIIANSLEVLELLIQAAYAKEKLRFLDQANLDLERLRFLLRLARELGPLSHNGYEYVMKQLTELGRQIGGWRKQASEAHAQNL